MLCRTVLVLALAATCAADGKTFYWDADGDGCGNPEEPHFAVVKPPGPYVENDLDCDDDNPALCQRSFYEDADRDGHGNASTVVQQCHNPELGEWVQNANDCDDTDPGVYVGAHLTLDPRDSLPWCTAMSGGTVRVSWAPTAVVPFTGPRVYTVERNGRFLYRGASLHVDDLGLGACEVGEYRVKPEHYTCDVGVWSETVRCSACMGECGNGVVEAGEECDTANVDTELCEAHTCQCMTRDWGDNVTSCHDPALL